ncbi:WD40 repeat-containing protein HOS15 [Trifolium repens]|nr:WD40 repeat-containing protein HOS15 [Trifolium repens]
MANNPFNTEGPFSSSQNKIANLISVRLDDKNFKQWKQQVSGVIRGFKLQRFITEPAIPERYLNDEDRIAGNVNPLFYDWENQDALVCTWLLSTMSEPLLAKVVDHTYSWQVWDEIHRHFEILLITKARQLRSELRTLTKGDRKVDEFIQRVRVINESLISIGDPVPHRNLVEIVLDALPEEYDPVVAAIASNTIPATIDELESYLLAHESRIDKNKKQNQLDAATVNLAQSSNPVVSSQNSTSDSPIPPSTSNFPSGTNHLTAHENQGNGYSRGGRSGRGGGRFGRGGRGGRGEGPCQICHRNNHDASICFYRNTGPMQGYGYGYRPPQPQYSTQFSNSYGYGAPRAQRPPMPQAMLTGGTNNFSNQWWYPDSGASHHVTPEATNLSDSASLPGTDQVLMGNGQGLSIASIGSMNFPSKSKPNSSLTLKHLLLVPSITKNLLSVSKFAQDNNVFFEFHPKFCVVKSQDSSEVLLHGTVGDDGLYKFASPSNSFPAFNKVSQQCNSVCLNSNSLHKLASECKSACMNYNSSSCLVSSTPIVNTAQFQINTSSFVHTPISHANYNLWHARLGHPHHDSLRIALQLCNINVPSKPQIDVCSACCLGKSHRLHAPLSKTTYNTPFELVVCDLWGPAPVKSSTGFTYFLTCVDAHSRFTWVYPLKLKSEAFPKFVEFKNMVELQFNTKIKMVQTDGGGEFRPFTKFLTNLGVIHRLTCPHTHHQNGIVERKHRHLVETGLTLLSQAQIPLKY